MDNLSVNTNSSKRRLTCPCGFQWIEGKNGSHDCTGAAKADPVIVADIKNSILYTIGESTIEVDMPKGLDDSFPFNRIG